MPFSDIAGLLLVLNPCINCPVYLELCCAPDTVILEITKGIVIDISSQGMFSVHRLYSKGRSGQAQWPHHTWDYVYSETTSSHLWSRCIKSPTEH